MLKYFWQIDEDTKKVHEKNKKKGSQEEFYVCAQWQKVKHRANAPTTSKYYYMCGKCASICTVMFNEMSENVKQKETASSNRLCKYVFFTLFHQPKEKNRQKPRIDKQIKDMKCK